ncbi:hypothetical protein AtubIFM55763_010570 [Aspergillus tubingensis]|uniref:Uncharacterized protein n=1 Tax=Aspergillus tubingensis TaxID=5068 RepID=A0A9W6AVY5_ASPTU|nr:hypothetical protein AtubIFM55763_010570 [Aspergillus tubingensis]GLA87664.1 hypothetical protein AtubIFM56815_002090 [Aspergillus tubingensis]
MPVTPLIFLLLGASTWATTLQKRDAATVPIDVYGLKTDIAALSVTFDGQDEEIDMEDDLNQAMNDAIASSTFATATSTRVTNSVTDLKPDILAILDKLVDNEIQAKVTTADKATIASVIVEVDAKYSSTTAAFY